MAKIGILGCDAVTREMDCVMIGCFGNLRSRKGEFARYAAEDPPELVGIISCGGCPTAVGSRKVWLKVKSLVEYGIQHLHLTSCLIQICPFKEEFKAALRREFPELEVIEGTHPFHDAEAFKRGVRELAVQKAVTPQKMNDIVFRRIKTPPPEEETP